MPTLHLGVQDANLGWPEGVPRPPGCLVRHDLRAGLDDVQLPVAVHALDVLVAAAERGLDVRRSLQVAAAGEGRSG